MDFRDIHRTLLIKLDAVEDRKHDHVFFYFVIDGHEHRATKLSHSARGQMDDSLISLVARQLRLKKQELSSLVDCPLGKEQFFQLWSERRGWLRSDHLP